MAIIKKVTYECGWCYRPFDESYSMDEIEDHHKNCHRDPKNKACPTCYHQKDDDDFCLCKERMVDAYKDSKSRFIDEYETNCEHWREW